jgi:hypothetical protein
VPDVAFNVTPTVSISQASGHVGMKLDITGSGFVPVSTLTISYGGTDIGGVIANTDPSGSFNLSINAPKSKAGAHAIKVSDGRGNESQATFTMENTSPRIPNPLLPKNNARTGLFGGARPTLKWADAPDPSGVTYTLQMDTSDRFSNLVLEKAGLTTPSYTLDETEALPRGGYYWRVKAVDGASNESAWSTSVFLKSGLMPLGAFIGIVGVAAVFAGSTAFFFLVYLPKRRREAAPVPEVRVTPAIPGYFRELGPETPPRAPVGGPARLPIPRLALPGGPTTRRRTTQPPQVQPQDQARVKMLAEFVRSLPLVQVSYDADWLMELASSSEGSRSPEDLHEQVLQGQLPLHYEPSWKGHPLYLELRTILEGHPIIQDLDDFIDAVNRCAAEATAFMQDIYRDTVTEVPYDVVKQERWRFIFGIYADALGWFRGRFLREPSERDYILQGAAELGQVGGESRRLLGDENTPFAGNLLEASDEAQAAQWRELHLRLRRDYRRNEKARTLVAMLTQLEVQRDRLLNTLGQLGDTGETRR